MIPPISLHGLATTSLFVSLLIAIFLPLRSLLRRAIGSQWLCVLWLALLVRLLIPLQLESRWGLINRWQTRPAVPAATWKIKVGVAETSDLKNNHADIPAMPSAGTAIAPTVHLARHVPEIIWLAGAMLGLCALAWRLRQTHRLAAATLPVTDQRLLNIFAAIPAKWRTGVELRMTAALEVPTLAGIFRPQIWMPLSWPAQFTDEELHGILLHELGHARRGDLLVQWLFTLAQCIHWFNPLVWLAARAARFDREMACDAWVLARNGAHSEYGSALMKTIQMLRTPLRALPATVAMASSRGSLRTRISGIGAFQSHPAWRGVAGIFLMIAALASVTTSRSTAQDSAAPASQPVTSQPVPAPDAQAAATFKNPGIKVETKFVEITEDAWKKLCAENPAFNDYNSKFPELAHEKTSYADLKDNLTQQEKGAWEVPSGEIHQLAVLSSEDLVNMIRACSQSQGLDLLAAPSVTTKDKQRALVEIIREYRYPAEYEENKNLKPVETTNSAGETMTVLPRRFTPTAFTTKNIGVSVEALPKLNGDGTLDLNLAPMVSSFMGYPTEKDGVKKLTMDSTFMAEIIHQSVFSTSTGKLTTTLRPGQTVLLGGVRLDNNGSKLSTEGTGPEPPPAPDNRKIETVRHILLVLVTPTIVNLDQPPPSSIATLPPTPPKDSKIPYGIPVKDKEGFVASPFAPDAGAIDVRGFPANTEVKDPYSGKEFLVP